MSARRETEIEDKGREEEKEEKTESERAERRTCLAVVCVAVTCPKCSVFLIHCLALLQIVPRSV